MKPPRRPRLAPARFVTGPGAAGAAERPRAPWSAREKRALLAALRAQAALGLPELQALPLRERLPRRSEAEIRAFLVRLRGRAAREAARSQFPQCRQRRAPPAPIEVWLDVAQALGGGALEEAAAAAFSQVLTLAGTEPLTLLRSAPPPPSAEGGAEGGDPSPAPGEPPPAAPPPFAVDFRRLYRYLGGLCRGGRGPALPPHESAVLLALLGALPHQLGALDGAALRAHLRRAYGALTAPPDPQPAPPDPPAPQPAPPDPQLAPPAPQAPPPGGWRGVGLCPLNPFLVPLRLLARAGPPG